MRGLRIVVWTNRAWRVYIHIEQSEHELQRTAHSSEPEHHQGYNTHRTQHTQLISSRPTPPQNWLLQGFKWNRACLPSRMTTEKTWGWKHNCGLDSWSNCDLYTDSVSYVMICWRVSERGTKTSNTTEPTERVFVRSSSQLRRPNRAAILVFRLTELMTFVSFVASGATAGTTGHL